jgi:hypothetical protein
MVSAYKGAKVKIKKWKLCGGFKIETSYDCTHSNQAVKIADRNNSLSTAFPF